AAIGERRNFDFICLRQSVCFRRRVFLFTGADRIRRVEPAFAAEIECLALFLTSHFLNERLYALTERLQLCLEGVFRHSLIKRDDRVQIFWESRFLWTADSSLLIQRTQFVLVGVKKLAIR